MLRAHGKPLAGTLALCMQCANRPCMIRIVRAQAFRNSSPNAHNLSLPSGAEALKERFMDRAAASVRRLSRPKEKRIETGSDGFEYFQYDPPWVKLTAWLLLNLRCVIAVALRALTIATFCVATLSKRGISLRDVLGVLRHLLS